VDGSGVGRVCETDHGQHDHHIHAGYLFGNASAVRTDAGLVLVDTGSRETASQTFAALRH
jgi:hypothetical protein